MKTWIRKAEPGDEPAIGELVLRAFDREEGPEIAELMRVLPGDPTARPLLHLVEACNDRLIGQILFTNAPVQDDEPAISSRILAPMSVDPDYQKRGVGRRLIEAGLEHLRADGVHLVFVLGDPAFYGRFGFNPASDHGLTAPHPIPQEHDDAWRVQELRPGILGTIRGTVSCADTLMDKRYWL